MTPKVLLVGKGPPDPGGIASYLQELAGAGSAVGHDLEFLNLARSEVRRAGRLTPSNLTRTLSDAWALGRAARQADIVHIHTALTPGVTWRGPVCWRGQRA